MNSTKLNELIGQYGLQCSETKELAPTTELAEGLKWVAQLETALAAAQRELADVKRQNAGLCEKVANLNQAKDVVRVGELSSLYINAAEKNHFLGADLRAAHREIEELKRRLEEEVRWGHKDCTAENCVSSGIDCPAALAGAGEGE